MIFISQYIRKKRYAEVINLISASIFGMTLEFLIILRYEGYHYSQKFLIQIGQYPRNIPVVIGLCWGMIIMSSISISDRFRIRNSVKPFFDTLQALTIDLSMDVVAIRIEGGFWVWGTPLIDNITETSYFGVTIGNFIAWYFVVLVFSYFIRLNRFLWEYKVNVKMILFNTIIPIIAYIPFYLLLEGERLSYYYLWLITGWIIPYYHYFFFGLLVLTALILVFRSFTKKSFSTTKSDSKFPLILFSSFHLFYFIMFLILGLFTSIPIAGIVAVMAMLIDFSVHFYLYKTGSSKGHSALEKNDIS